MEAERSRVTSIRELWQHQRTAVERALPLRQFGLLFEPGCGKTLTAITIARHKYAEHKRLLRTLVLCPQVVTHNWRKEWLEGSKLKPEQVVALPAIRRVAKFRDECFATKHGVRQPVPRVVVTNYEALLSVEFLEDVVTWSPELIIFDESHKLKDASAKRSKACYRLAKIADYRYILTGTPVLNSPMDLFGQFKVLDLGETFGDSFYAFRGSYFVDKNAGMPKSKHFPKWVPRSDRMPSLSYKVSLSSMRVKKEDCLDLPPLVRQVIDVPLTPEQRRIYKELERDFITFVEGKACVAQIALTKILRMLQVTSGFVPLEDDMGEREERALADTPREKALYEILESVLAGGGKAVIWAVFRRNYDTVRAVCKKLGVPLLELTGETPTAKRQEAIDLFETSPDYPVLLGHPASGGIGVNLIAASTAIFFSRTHNLGDDIQAEARNYRGGSERHTKVTRIDIVASGTIDEVVYQALAAKKNMAEELVDIVKQLRGEDDGPGKKDARQDTAGLLQRGACHP